MYEDEADVIADMVPIRLYFTNEDNTKLFMEIRYISMEEAKKSVNTIASTIVKELINGPDAKTGLKRTIPEGAKLRSPVSINGNIATVDFTKEFVDNHPGGKSAEQITIFSIVNSLTELRAHSSSSACSWASESNSLPAEPQASFTFGERSRNSAARYSVSAGVTCANASSACPPRSARSTRSDRCGAMRSARMASTCSRSSGFEPQRRAIPLRSFDRG